MFPWKCIHAVMAHNLGQWVKEEDVFLQRMASLPIPFLPSSISVQDLRFLLLNAISGFWIPITTKIDGSGFWKFKHSWLIVFLHCYAIRDTFDSILGFGTSLYKKTHTFNLPVKIWEFFKINVFVYKDLSGEYNKTMQILSNKTNRICMLLLI